MCWSQNINMVIRNVLQVFHTYKKEQVYHEKKNHNGSGDSCCDSGCSCDCINSGTDTGIDLMKNRYRAENGYNGLTNERKIRIINISNKYYY